MNQKIPNVYIILVGEPGTGKSLLSNDIKDFLDKNGCPSIQMTFDFDGAIYEHSLHVDTTAIVKGHKFF